jgi:hypothetical protein
MFIIPPVLLLRTLVCTSMEARIVFYGSKNRRRTMHIRTRLKWTRGRRGRRRRRQQIGSNQSLAPLSVSFLITLYACPRRMRRSFSSRLHKQSIQHIRCMFKNNVCVTFWSWPVHKSIHSEVKIKHWSCGNIFKKDALGLRWFSGHWTPFNLRLIQYRGVNSFLKLGGSLSPKATPRGYFDPGNSMLLQKYLSN